MDSARGFVEAQHGVIPASGEDDVGMQGIRGNVSEFKAAHGKPVAVGNLAVVAAIGHSRGAAVLLLGINVVGELVVGDHVVKLSCGLVEPGGPGVARVERNRGALVHAENHAL